MVVGIGSGSYLLVAVMHRPRFLLLPRRSRVGGSVADALGCARSACPYGRLERSGKRPPILAERE
ncbi:hypothetical protein GCM10010358_76720 [Streptomyces minutiscleroticus]|uniref:Uncharacterized protein n=1 Tax=Streptomyces minutiscleroticus TaxID=68238 RepID=A0A918U9D5_9ACTN|nr:hypothetical protein GCM10010358_76720 [Streptomyces minutiscleroticus]